MLQGLTCSLFLKLSLIFIQLYNWALILIYLSLIQLVSAPIPGAGREMGSGPLPSYKVAIYFSPHNSQPLIPENDCCQRMDTSLSWHVSCFRFIACFNSVEIVVSSRYRFPSSHPIPRCYQRLSTEQIGFFATLCKIFAPLQILNTAAAQCSIAHGGYLWGNLLCSVVWFRSIFDVGSMGSGLTLNYHKCKYNDSESLYLPTIIL